MWEVDHKAGLVPKNWCFQIVALEKTLESPLDCKEIKPVNPKETNAEYSMEGLLLKLKFQYCGHLMWRADSLEKNLMLGKTEGKRRRELQRTRWLDRIINSIDMNLTNPRKQWRTEESVTLEPVWLRSAGHDLATQQQQATDLLETPVWFSQHQGWIVLEGRSGAFPPSSLPNSIFISLHTLKQFYANPFLFLHPLLKTERRQLVYLAHPVSRVSAHLVVDAHTGACSYHKKGVFFSKSIENSAIFIPERCPVLRESSVKIKRNKLYHKKTSIDIICFYDIICML